MGHPTIPDDILAAAEDLIPQMDAEPGKNMRGSTVFYAAMAIKQEHERCAKIADAEALRARRSKDVEVREAFTANKIAAAIRARGPG
ncbi:hypothetical protein [Bosea sp. ASV33]|uniref:hypothetical protein n=1 Tax=Bosea sp. ASV33 TaxID=2795106 RepID=UPI0018EDDA09|nr:hypothetical protein [Bosea sp. ASV33]